MEEHLIGYGLQAFALMVSALLIRGKIPPNRFVGFRTEDTLSGPEDWYRFNRVLGWCLAGAAVLSLAVNLTLWWAVPEWPLERTVFWMKVGWAVPALIGIGLSVRYCLRPP